MKTTLDLPDELMREVKHRAVDENRTLKETVAELLRIGLEHPLSEPELVLEPGKLPLIRMGRKARPGHELTPERIAEILIEQEAEWARDLMR
jgi:hypothetical protein